jgi:lipopolysaccharide/colanic/teichoic acid biosynthesis glycosyltransferase
MTANILIKTSKIIALPLDAPVEQEKQAVRALAPCRLKWRSGKLWVKPSPAGERPTLPALASEQWAIECLQRSSVRLVCLDPALGEEGLIGWANVCKQANKKVVLRVSSRDREFQTPCSLSWWFKRSLDWIAAALMLLLLSPVCLGLAWLIRRTSPGPIFFRQWRVGKRGQLFEIVKFRSMVFGAERQHHQVMGEQAGLHKRQDDPRITPLGAWMRKYSLDELPQLINVMRGEMSLVGPRPWALYDALRLGDAGKQRLKALPGITGPWQVEARSNLLDLEGASQYDLEYLRNWSLWRDIKLLVMTIPKVVSGFGAY